MADMEIVVAGRAAMFAQMDHMTGVSENIMLGQLAPLGTGSFGLMLDESKLADAIEVKKIQHRLCPHRLWSCRGFFCRLLFQGPILLSPQAMSRVCRVPPWQLTLRIAQLPSGWLCYEYGGWFHFLQVQYAPELDFDALGRTPGRMTPGRSPGQMTPGHMSPSSESLTSLLMCWLHALLLFLQVLLHAELHMSQD